MKALNFIVLLLIVIGALNWGLWGFFQFDLVAWLCSGNTTWMSRVIYSIIGLAGLKGICFLTRCACRCSGCKCGTKKGSGSCKM